VLAKEIFDQFLLLKEYQLNKNKVLTKFFSFVFEVLNFLLLLKFRRKRVEVIYGKGKTP
jgi:hypothetical protein